MHFVTESPVQMANVLCSLVMCPLFHIKHGTRSNDQTKRTFLTIDNKISQTKFSFLSLLPTLEEVNLNFKSFCIVINFKKARFCQNYQSMLFLDILNFYIAAENQCFSSKFSTFFHSANLKKIILFEHV